MWAVYLLMKLNFTKITLTFDSLEVEPKEGQGPNVIGHFVKMSYTVAATETLF